jgi:hypothetical protein
MIYGAAGKKITDCNSQQQKANMSNVNDNVNDNEVISVKRSPLPPSSGKANARPIRPTASINSTGSRGTTVMSARDAVKSKAGRLGMRSMQDALPEEGDKSDVDVESDNDAKGALEDDLNRSIREMMSKVDLNDVNDKDTYKAFCDNKERWINDEYFRDFNKIVEDKGSRELGNLMTGVKNLGESYTKSANPHYKFTLGQSKTSDWKKLGVHHLAIVLYFIHVSTEKKVDDLIGKYDESEVLKLLKAILPRNSQEMNVLLNIRRADDRSAMIKKTACAYLKMAIDDHIVSS